MAVIIPDYPDRENPTITFVYGTTTTEIHYWYKDGTHLRQILTFTDATKLVISEVGPVKAII